jgi:hypothetical protein
MGEWKIRTGKNKKSGGKLAGLADKAYAAGNRLGSPVRAVAGAAKAFVGGVMGAERAPKKSSGKKQPGALHAGQAKAGKKAGEKKASPRKNPFDYIK